MATTIVLADGTQAQALLGRSGARFTERDIPNRKQSHNFACVAHAYANVLLELGFPVTAADAQRLHRESNDGSRGSGRHTAGETTLTAVNDLLTRKQWPAEVRVYQPAKTLTTIAGKLDRAGFPAAVISSRTPSHAFALSVHDGDTPVVIDNGGWGKGQTSWLGRNVKAVVGLRRTDGRDAAEAAAEAKAVSERKAETARRRREDRARVQARWDEIQLAKRRANERARNGGAPVNPIHIRGGEGESPICGATHRFGDRYVRADHPTARMIANCPRCQEIHHAAAIQARMDAAFANGDLTVAAD